jgi:prepilin-type N-terminal cleavage/methylation domain-containing protein
MNSARNSRRSGYTLIEALVSMVIVGIAIVGCLSTLSAMTRSEDRSLMTEKMHRLASEKLDEIIATEDFVNTSLSGNFDDRGETGFSWQVEVEPTGESNLDAVSVTITKESGSKAEPIKAIALVYIPESTTSGTTQPSGAQGASR